MTLKPVFWPPNLAIYASAVKSNHFKDFMRQTEALVPEVAEVAQVVGL